MARRQTRSAVSRPSRDFAELPTRLVPALIAAQMLLWAACSPVTPADNAPKAVGAQELGRLARDVFGQQGLIMTTDRAPFHFTGTERMSDAKLSGGGVVTALATIPHYATLYWLARARSEADRFWMAKSGALRPDRSLDLEVVFLDVPEEAARLHYQVIANPILWFRFHGFEHPLYTEPFREVTEEIAWEHGYRLVNERYAKEVIARLSGDRTECEAAESPGPPKSIWNHDYQLLLVPGLVRDATAGSELTIFHFHHIPWPEVSAFSKLNPSWRQEIIASLLKANLLGLQTEVDLHNFIACARKEFPGLEIGPVHPDGSVDIAGLIPRENALADGARADFRVQLRARAYPISVDPDAVRSAYRERIAPSRSQEDVDLLAAVRAVRAASDLLVMRIERVDPTKGTVLFLEAYLELMKEIYDPAMRVASSPNGVALDRLRQKVVGLVLWLVPSREEVLAYRSYAARVESLMEEIRIFMANRPPLVAGTGRSDPPALTKRDIEARRYNSFHAQIDVYHQALATMGTSDVLAVTPVRDGMNLVTKEFAIVNLESQEPRAREVGALVLSDGAGAFTALREGVFGVHMPQSATQDEKRRAIKHALLEALTADNEEVVRKANALAAQVRSHTVRDWLATQLLDLKALGSR